MIERIQLEVPIERNGEFTDGKEKTVIKQRKRPLRAGRPLSQNWAEDVLKTMPGLLIVTVRIAGAHLGSGGP